MITNKNTGNETEESGRVEATSFRIVQEHDEQQETQSTQPLRVLRAPKSL